MAGTHQNQIPLALHVRSLAVERGLGAFGLKFSDFISLRPGYARP